LQAVNHKLLATSCKLAYECECVNCSIDKLNKKDRVNMC